MSEEGSWTVHRRPGARRIALKHSMWRKPMYLRVDDAQALLNDIAECLGVEPPEVPMRTPCPAVAPIAAGAGEVYIKCQAWAEEHIFGTHYHTTPDGVKITWSQREGE